MAAMLMRFSDTARGRKNCVLLSGAVFGALHMTSVFGGTELAQALIGSLAAGILGLVFAAAYLRSKNLLSCMLVHALWNIIAKSARALSPDTLSVVNLSYELIVLFVMPVFALKIASMAEPFYCNQGRNNEKSLDS